MIFMWTNKPEKFGTLHIIMIIIAVIVFAVSTFFGYRYQDEKYEKKKKLLLTIFGFSLIGLEIVKIIFSFAVGVADLTLIPFQLCSTPMYLLIPIYFIKNEKIQKTFISYLSFIGLTASIAYFVNPTAMLKPDYVFLSFYSAIFHVLLVGINSFTFVSFEAGKKENLKYYPFSFIIFIVFSLIAVTCNFIAHSVNSDTVVNFFYLHPLTPATFPVIDTLVKPYVPFPVYYIVFLISFFIMCFIPYAIFFVIEIIRRKIASKKKIDSSVQMTKE